MNPSPAATSNRPIADFLRSMSFRNRARSLNAVLLFAFGIYLIEIWRRGQSFTMAFVGVLCLLYSLFMVVQVYGGTRLAQRYRQKTAMDSKAGAD